MVSKKDFIITAEILATTKASKKTINSFANSFSKQNPQFNKKRFANFIRKRRQEIQRIQKEDFS